MKTKLEKNKNTKMIFASIPTIPLKKFEVLKITKAGV